MRKLIITICLIFCFTTNVHAESYCVMSGNDGTVTKEKDMHETQSVASISKIMTALIAIEQGNLNDTWVISDDVLKINGSSVYLIPKETVTLEALLYGLMLRSGNDTAHEIALCISGSEEAFVKEMNEKAKILGMNDTLFCNPSGLDEEDGGNISSAYDMALLMRYAMNNETFSKIVSSEYYDFKKGVRWKNKNKLLFTYDKTTGGKTGFTKRAGRTLVTSASNDDTRSIVVSLNMGNDFAFHEKSHEELFEQYAAYVILKAGLYHISNHTFVIEQTLQILLSKTETTQLEVHTKVENHTLIIEVNKDGVLQTYTYEGTADKGGWFS
ncbi:MAG: D-alanyl-D-alanine carboxypeptidase [Erysipelotrichaceae bacterium]|nr:D-alanyl-D-alanine carboxypeptidase [Erysipelotrichaceae bacterium]